MGHLTIKAPSGLPGEEAVAIFIASARAGKFGTAARRNRGAAHKHDFWRGYDGLKALGARGSFAWFAWQAGKRMKAEGWS